MKYKVKHVVTVFVIVTEFTQFHNLTSEFDWKIKHNWELLAYLSVAVKLSSGLYLFSIDVLMT